ncbi:Transposon Ty3-I Gag-Pol polyprotein [Trichinella sp. T8]|nr:Transposon Ty3-I Gag-Pol polyprotein [Trichinella sp. T8]
MLHGRLTFMHLATADTIVGDNSRALLRLVSGIHATITCMAPFSKATKFQLLWRMDLSSDDPLSAEIRTRRQSREQLTREILRVIIPQRMSLSPQAASARLLMTEAVRSELLPPGSTRDISWQDPWKPRLLDTYGQSESQMTMTDGSRVRIVHEAAPEVPLEETVREGTDTDSVQLEACERTLARAECSARNPRVLRILLRRYGKAISCGDANLRRTNLVQHRIETGGAQPVKLPPRRLPQAQREVVDHLIREMLHAGVIELPSGPWSSPVVLVRKKDLSPPFCVDYRRLNAVTRVNAQPMPRIDDTLTALAGAKWFSTLDLASGYWQVEVRSRDREKTVFSTPLGLFQFRVIPFGLCKAPATFQRLEKALRGLTWNTCLVYLDGIMVFGKTEEDGHVPILIHRKAAHLKLR